MKIHSLNSFITNFLYAYIFINYFYPLLHEKKKK